jgi:hypothetical protein
LFIAFGRYVRPETLFVAAIQWGLTGLLVGLAKSAPGRAHPWLCTGCAALGVASLAKDPIGLVGPLIAVAVTLALTGRLRPLSRWLSPAGALLGLLIGLGWYVVVAFRQPGFVWYTIVDNHLLNAVQRRHFPDEDVPLSTAEFLAVSVLGAVPWIIPAVLAVTWMARRRAWRNPEETAWTALGVWVVGLLALFALVPFKLPHYALPAYPAIALLAARGWEERPQWTRGLIIAHVALFAVLAGMLAVVARSDGRVFLDAIRSAIDVYTRKEAAVGETAPFPSWSVLAPLVARTAVVFGVGSAALLGLLLRQAHEFGRWVVLGTMLAAMPAVTVAVSAVASSRAVRTMAVELRGALGAQDLLVHEGPIENAGALELYSGRRPVLLDATRTVLGFGSTFPDARAMFWDAERFRREWCTGRRILLVTPRAHQQSSIVARLPAGSLRLRVSENGRRLYETGPAGSRETC